MQLISQQEMYGFLGINIAMGYHKLPSWTDYWKGDQDLSVPFVSSAPQEIGLLRYLETSKARIIMLLQRGIGISYLKYDH